MAKPSAKRFTRVSTERNDAMTKVAQWIVDCESNEYDNYVSFCSENGLRPENIHGRKQKNHAYALALAGLGLEFPKE